MRSFDPYYSLTLMLELRGPDYSRSPTPRVVQLEVKLATFKC